MKKIVSMLAASACAAGIATPALGQTRPGFEAGLEAFQIGYKEFNEGDLFIREEGSMLGIRLGYVQPIAGGLFGRVILSGAAGSVDYDPLDEPVVKDIDQSSGRIELHLGYDFMLGRTSITPFTGYAPGCSRTRAAGARPKAASSASTARSPTITFPSAWRRAFRWAGASGSTCRANIITWSAVT
jgi:hypothetical protein